MYIITWLDYGEQKTLKVSTAQAVRDVTNTLQRRPSRYTEVRATNVPTPRKRELVIVFEN